MNKILEFFKRKAPFWGLGACFLLYFSIEIRPLDEVKKANQKFDAKVFAKDFYEKTLPKSFDKAIEINSLVSMIQQDKTKAFKEYSQAVSIGNIRNFLVKGEGKIVKINESDLMLQSNGLTYKIATEYIYGNAIRDASGQFDIKPFTNTEDINNIAAEINRIVRNSVIPNIKKQARIGDSISFIGAIEMNQEHVKLENIEVYPIFFRDK
jgi:predicted lipoprotein